MGDMADHLTEQGQQAYWEHLDGRCDGPCPYCEKEANEPQPDARAKLKALLSAYPQADMPYHLSRG